jgi:arginyl-tRNA synthetase
MKNRTAAAQKVEERPDPNQKLVKVFDTEQESEAMVVRGLLESAGIDADMTALNAPQDTFPGVGGTIILVRSGDAAAARRLIEEYRQAPVGETDETAEVDISEEPPGGN